jgi:F-type H+-transporting ATPase subunit delta
MNASYVEQVSTPGALSPEELEKAQHLYEDILLQSDSSRIAGRLARTYAEALLAIAEQRGEADAVHEDLRSLGRDLCPNIPGFEAFLDSPAISKKRKDEFITKALEGRATPLLVDFLRLLNRKDRLGSLRLIAIAYRSLRDSRANRLRVLVETAAPLTEEQKTVLTETLAETTGKTPVLVVREKPELIGGVVVHIGDRVFDTSVRTKLRTIRNQLLVRGTHEIQSRRDRFCN